MKGTRILLWSLSDLCYPVQVQAETVWQLNFIEHRGTHLKLNIIKYDFSIALHWNSQWKTTEKELQFKSLLSYGKCSEILDYDISTVENSQCRAKSKDIKPCGLQPHFFPPFRKKYYLRWRGVVMLFSGWYLRKRRKKSKDTNRSLWHCDWLWYISEIWYIKVTNNLNLGIETDILLNIKMYTFILYQKFYMSLFTKNITNLFWMTLVV